MYCYCCDRRLASAPCDCREGACVRWGGCPSHCRCLDPWIVREEDDEDEPLIVPAVKKGEPLASQRLNRYAA